ncbi:hypothetical protein MSAN_00378500 [Mycena sanguinolenta]|uniref:Uncharacterized protein n=1 Tax=Mycena sanguinolenta TaxID=230812 RepID=A0A8H6ZCF2_9AGAR|nr:hypothetical protein MSAN_00378500 [Mycena sanguinolenta]
MNNANLWYTLPNETLYRCIQCPGSFPARLFNGRTKLCVHCQINFDLGRIPDPNPHPNHLAQQTRYCGDCNHLVGNNAQEWNPQYGRCRGCAADYVENQAQRRAFRVLENETRVRITVPVRRICALCEEQHGLRSFQDSQTGETHTQCRRCRKSLRCTRCNRIKRKSHFRKPAGTAGTSAAGESFYRRCSHCRETEEDRLANLRAAADAAGTFRYAVGCPGTQRDAGLRYCARGNHRVPPQQFLAPDGSEYLTCQECLSRRRNTYAARANQTGQAQADRDAENQGDGIVPDEDDEGVHAEPVDDFDALFGDGSDLAGVDLPQDSAISPNEAQCLKNFDAALDAVTISACSCCREAAFDIKLKASGECGRCHSDKRDIKLWSDENRVNPNASHKCLTGLTLIVFYSPGKSPS